MRVFPTENESKELLQASAQHKWYYNACNDVFDFETHMNNVEEHKNEDNPFAPSVIWGKLRDELRRYKYTEERENNVMYCQLKYDKTLNQFPAPSWMENSFGALEESKAIHNRVARGAIHNFVGNLNSCTSSYYNGQIDSFKMSNKTSKGKHEFIYFEDNSFPAFIKKIKGQYSYRLSRGNNKRRTNISWKDLLSLHPKSGCTVIQDKQTKAWYIYLPVERTWFPPSDHRSEKQGNMIKGKAIGLDPGMRKFLTGLDSEGATITFGDRAYKQLTPLLWSIRKIEIEFGKHRKNLIHLDENERNNFSINKRVLWARVKNLVQEMHWKCADYLVKNYEFIFLEDFKPKSCLMSNNIPSFVKRIINQYSFYQFKQRLEYKCETSGCKLIYVHPALTTKTCSECGNLSHNVGKSESYRCSNCFSEFDRDENSGKNILIKGLTVLKTRLDLV